jgi:hypothetical protein
MKFKDNVGKEKITTAVFLQTKNNREVQIMNLCQLQVHHKIQRNRIEETITRYSFRVAFRRVLLISRVQTLTSSLNNKP